jgi:uncharacterized 2Fe-2S/4Fe-4S cluster protein (DUF4445 family)
VTDYVVAFMPIGRKGKCRDSETILACARRLGLGISSVCGGRGTCHTCRIQVLSGILSEPTRSEIEVFSPQELSDGWRLACQVHPRRDCRLSVPAESMTTAQRLQVEGLAVTVTPEPVIKGYHLRLPVPSLDDPQADADRILEELNQQYGQHCTRVDIDVLRTISPKLRAWNWECQATVRNDEVIAVGLWSSRQLGLAIDLGTTKIAGYLVDLSNGKTLASQGLVNPQASYGDDIISRISAVIKSPDGGATLKKLALEALNDLAVSLCAGVAASVEEIVDAVVVGNTAMHHLFLGLPVEQLALSPFAPVISHALDMKAREAGLQIASGAFVHLLPNVAGFVGADHVAMLLATGVAQAEGPVVALDIGTNTELSLVNNGRIMAVSCASGPAFEGGHIKYGMRASRGAIERLRIKGDEVQYQTIDEAPPVGICGSGILDAVAQLYLAGIVDEGGRIKANHPRVRTDKGQREFVLVDRQKEHPAITITQKDVRELQLAKAAIRTGIQLLLETKGFTEEQIRQVVIAGAFGSYIDLSSAVTVGLLPPLPLNYFRQVGNAAGMGAKLALLSLTKREEAQAIASRARYIELASAPNFRQVFIETSHIGRYRIKHGKREEVD